MPSRADSDTRPAPTRMLTWLGFCGFLAVAVFFLWTEHRAHLFGALPYLLVLLCPLIHLFMHGGRGQHRASDEGHESHPHMH